MDSESSLLPATRIGEAENFSGSRRWCLLLSRLLLLLLREKLLHLLLHLGLLLCVKVLLHHDLLMGVLLLWYHKLLFDLVFSLVRLPLSIQGLFDLDSERLEAESCFSFACSACWTPIARSALSFAQNCWLIAGESSCSWSR